MRLIRQIINIIQSIEYQIVSATDPTVQLQALIIINIDGLQCGSVFEVMQQRIQIITITNDTTLPRMQTPTPIHLPQKRSVTDPINIYEQKGVQMNYIWGLQLK
ncbi:Hypothetical_protein [Hexamita inflata]|uniref:Hypothetical_protein n=1 Tax=Hexamita inflata TaxID=28002 RepID=A0AA86PKZ6_9EUKA|nr:Hypothetical protein HINF_LOCUS28048 [Hexamita inflata]